MFFSHHIWDHIWDYFLCYRMRMKAKSPDSEWVRSQRKANVSASDRWQQTWPRKQDAFVPLWSFECLAMLDKQEPFYSNQPKCCSPWQIFQRRPASLAGLLLWWLVLKITAFFPLPDCLWEIEARFQQQAKTDKRCERFLVKYAASSELRAAQ